VCRGRLAQQCDARAHARGTHPMAWPERRFGSRPSFRIVSTLASGVPWNTKLTDVSAAEAHAVMKRVKSALPGLLCWFSRMSTMSSCVALAARNARTRARCSASTSRPDRSNTRGGRAGSGASRGRPAASLVRSMTSPHRCSAAVSTSSSPVRSITSEAAPPAAAAAPAAAALAAAAPSRAPSRVQAAARARFAGGSCARRRQLRTSALLELRRAARCLRTARTVRAAACCATLSVRAAAGRLPRAKGRSSSLLSAVKSITAGAAARAGAAAARARPASG
jgi:hypothetical protein